MSFDELLPNVVDRLARERPDAEYAEWVTATSVVAITYKQLANIINGLSWWLVEQLGPGPHGPNRDVLAYVGPNDVRYGALVLAAIKTGYVIFVTSPRNSPAAHRALFDRVQCRTFLTTDPLPPPAGAILNAVKPLQHLTVPSLEELLNKENKPYVLSKTYQELRDDPFVVMHTSGSTGLPKPIIWTQETCNRVLKSKSQEAPDGTASVEGTLVNGKRVIVTLPPFHGALLAQLMCGAIPFGNVVIAPVAAAIPTAQAVVDALKKSPADVGLLVPSVVAELGQSILYIGGDLPQDLGSSVASKVYLRSLWGATETGIVPQLLPSALLPSSSSARDLWRYVKIHPTVGAIFDQVTDDGIYELVVRRDEALADTQPVFTVAGLEQAEEYRTKDLFERHPSIDDLWCWRARADDIIVFLNGEKTNPISMEQHIVHQNPELNGALVIGAQRFQAALLIEPVSDSPLTTAEQAALIERVWPSVEEANRSAPAHARVEKSFILVVPADRRLIRAPKGTFLRGPSISQYTAEIDKLYGNADVVADDEDDGTGEAVLHTTGLDGITSLLRQQVRAVTGWSNLNENDSLFDQGMDSLQGLQLTRALRRSFRRPDLALSTIYNNPTVSQLAAAIVEGKDSGVDERKVMETLLSTYRGLIQHIPVRKDQEKRLRDASEPVNVLLTGSTGTVGTYLLRALLDRDGIGHVFCLSRREDGGRAAQTKSFTAAGLATNELDNEDRVTFIHSDFQKPSLGLDGPTYELLQSKIGLVIHAAWPVNFNLTLAAFRPQLAGLVNFLALASLASAQFIFVSSVAAVGGYRTGPPPEEILQDLDTSGPIGYGRAKLLGELLVDSAAQHLGNTVPTTIIRVGQAAGPVRRGGLWNPNEWLPSLVLSSLHLGKVPDSLGPLFDNVDFVPIDLLADVLVDLSTATTGQAASGATVFNLRNPRLTPWRTLLPAVIDAAVAKHLEVVTPAAWLASLLASSEEEGGDGKTGINKNPALKLLDFFQTLWPPADTAAEARAALAPAQPMVVDRALAASPSLRELEPVSLEWMRKWVHEWTDGRSGLQ
ncbi:putative NRPS-like protein biosynthetic cluster [Cytospora paraplurivora]|uniref:NRPS-like protein biosynthetic cluster n=1 Tax=Cytospora paraplurivora TaxID=2898453 RepID=A0AAN9UCG8_9PEZI